MSKFLKKEIFKEKDSLGQVTWFWRIISINHQIKPVGFSDESKIGFFTKEAAERNFNLFQKHLKDVK